MQGLPEELQVDHLDCQEAILAGSMDYIQIQTDYEEEHRSLSVLNKSEGTWTAFSDETMEILVHMYIPVNEEDHKLKVMQSQSCEDKIS